MAYVTTTQLSARLGSAMYARLTDRVNGATADSAVAQQIIDEAAAEADSYLAVRYATPVDLSARPELADMFEARVLDLAEYAAWKASPFVSDLPQRVQRIYAAAISWFTAVAAGQVDLPAAAAPSSRTATDDSPRYAADERRFTHDELDGL